jgi:hypothetical protein
VQAPDASSGLASASCFRGQVADEIKDGVMLQIRELAGIKE